MKIKSVSRINSNIEHRIDYYHYYQEVRNKSYEKAKGLIGKIVEESIRIGSEEEITVLVGYNFDDEKLFQLNIKDFNIYYEL